MIKIILCIIALYVLYYLSLIAYDLFLKKDNAIVTEQTEEFTLDPTVVDEPISVEIEDVEDIVVPSSFTKKETKPTESHSRQDLEKLRARFESEEEFDDDDQPSPIEEKGDVQETTLEETKINVLENKAAMKNIVAQANSMVQMIANYDGHKVFKSTLN